MKGETLFMTWPSFHEMVDSSHEIPVTSYQCNVPRIIAGGRAVRSGINYSLSDLFRPFIREAGPAPI